MESSQERGRPLDLTINQRILDATIELLPQKGYQVLTTEDIAKKAQVGKAAIYRRWKSKKELVFEAVQSINPFEDILEKNSFQNSNKDLREQLIDLLCYCFLDENELYHHALVALAAALPKSDRERNLHIEFTKGFKTAIETVISPFISGDEKLKESKILLLTDISQSLIVYRVLLQGSNFDKAYIEEIVDTLMIPMLITNGVGLERIN